MLIAFLSSKYDKYVFVALGFEALKTQRNQNINFKTVYQTNVRKCQHLDFLFVLVYPC